MHYVGKGKRPKGWRLFSHIEGAIHSDALVKPLWWDGYKKYPPLQLFSRGAPRKLVYPEDRLRNIYLKRHPEEQASTSKTTATHSTWFLPASDVFIGHQMNFMKQGYSEADAYELAENKMKERSYLRSLEGTLAEEKAKRMGWLKMPLLYGVDSRLKKYKEAARIAVERVQIPDQDALNKQFKEHLDQNPEKIPLHWLEGLTDENIITYIREHPQHAQYFPTFYRDLATQSALKTVGIRVAPFAKELEDLETEWKEEETKKAPRNLMDLIPKLYTLVDTTWNEPSEKEFGVDVNLRSIFNLTEKASTVTGDSRSALEDYLNDYVRSKDDDEYGEDYEDEDEEQHEDNEDFEDAEDENWEWEDDQDLPPKSIPQQKK